MSSDANVPPQETPTTSAADPQHGGPQPTRSRPPHRVIIEQPFAFGRRVFIFALLFALGISIMFNLGLWGAYQSYRQTDPKVNELLHSGEVKASDKVAIITVSGPIMQSEGFVKRQIDHVSKDKRVKAVVLRVDSPGGTVTASHYLYHHLRKLRKEKDIPLVVSMGGLAASGGYYVSMAAGDQKDVIFAEDSTWTGSIGVIIPNYNISELLARWDIEDRSIASGSLKQMGSPTRTLDNAQQELETEKFKQLVDESFGRFKKVLAYGRPELVKDEQAMTEVVTGQIFTADQAYRLGLVDQLGYIEDAIERAAELADLKEGAYRVVKFQRPVGLLDVALGQGSAKSTELSALLDLTSPRAYYICTWLPSLVANSENRQ